MAESYVKEAFLMKPNLLGLGAGVVVASVLPFTGPLLLGVAALEGVYLWSMSKNPRFQRMVRSRRGRERVGRPAVVRPAPLPGRGLFALRQQQERGRRRGITPARARSGRAHRPAGRLGTAPGR